MCITISEYKTYKQITDNSSDAIISAMIPYAQNIIEDYLDRNLIESTKYTWFDISDLSNNEIFLDDYPISRVIYVGLPSAALTITGQTENQSILITETGIFIYADPFAVPTEVSFTTYPALADVKTAIETLVPALTVNINSPTNTPSKLLVPTQASNGSQIYYAKKANIGFQIINNRTIAMTNLDSFVSNCYGLNGLNNLVYIVYVAGYPIANVPQALKKVCMDMVSDLINVVGPQSNSNIKSESEGDYSYSLGDMSNLAGDIVSKYSKDLDGFRKKFI